MFETNKELSPIGGGASSGLSQLSLGLQRQTRREVERVQARAIVAKLTEDGRAFLTHTALEHVGGIGRHQHGVRQADEADHGEEQQQVPDRREAERVAEPLADAVQQRRGGRPGSRSTGRWTPGPRGR